MIKTRVLGVRIKPDVFIRIFEHLGPMRGLWLCNKGRYSPFEGFGENVMNE